MGLLGNLIGAVLGGGGGGGNAGSQQNVMVSVLLSLLQSQGGIQGLLGKFGKAGLGDAAQSWVGTGDNHAVSGDQISSVLGGDALKGVAEKLGIDPGQAAGMLAQHLPGIIDKLTPKGQVEEGQDVQGALGSILPGLLQGGLGALLGGK